MAADKPIRIMQWGMFGSIGGIERFMMDLYRNMDRDLVQFDFLAAHDAPKLAFEEEIADYGGRIFRAQYSQSESAYQARHSLLKVYREHPDIVGVHVHACFPYAYPLAVARECGIRLRILHAHGAFDVQPKLDIHSRVAAAVRDRLVRGQIDRHPTRYLACSDSAARYMFPGKPYLWAKNGIDVERFGFSPDVRQRYRRRYDIGESTHVLGFCGYLTGRKNPLLALEVFAHYRRMQPDSVLMMIGCGELSDRLEQRVRELALPERSVLFMGGNRDDVNCLYQMMDGFLLTSLYEGLPMVLVEAQCAGLPCVASREAVTDQAAITDLLRFCSLQDDALIWARALREGVVRRRDRGSYASRVAMAGFDMRATAAMLQRIYLTEGGRS
ncbi:glycosyl transferase family 1 [Bifidobacterium sp. DSM 109959]|uniref:Glycosyl transferase family 1 n=2 Tax=Bifidobacterium olomucense TaxID=2675324 RepID=A0A7Y0EWN5_9BIFI|nr:glycosyl transferase family 1 [Bifidobacterium sp. DSM 109959]